jgi:hypothetical protein
MRQRQMGHGRHCRVLLTWARPPGAPRCRSWPWSRPSGRGLQGKLERQATHSAIVVGSWAPVNIRASIDHSKRIEHARVSATPTGRRDRMIGIAHAPSPPSPPSPCRPGRGHDGAPFEHEPTCCPGRGARGCGGMATSAPSGNMPNSTTTGRSRSTGWPGSRSAGRTNAPFQPRARPAAALRGESRLGRLATRSLLEHEGRKRM